MKKEVNIAYPPPLYLGYGIAYWERTLSPFHKDTFVNTVIYDLIQYTREPRKEGWMAIDCGGNCVAYVEDGSLIDKHDVQYILKESYPGRVCAVPSDNLDIFQSHF